MKNLIDRVKLAFRKDRKFYSSLYKILGFYPRHIEYYRIALAHSSKGYRTKQGERLNNERLEYLGDAVLETVVSDILFHKYPEQREGFLSSTRSKLVQRSMLGKLAKEMGIERLVSAKGRQNAHNSYLGGNAFEALVGAVYLDRGFDHCQKFVRQRILDSIVDVDDVAQRETNFKSRLLEWSQKNRLNCEFILVAQTKETRNTPLFTTLVKVEGVEVERGTGYSRKESEQEAARRALVLLRADSAKEDAIFAVVEARTAMEAPRLCAVPRIPELEQAVLKLRAELKRKRSKAGDTEQPKAPEKPSRKASPAPAVPTPDETEATMPVAKATPEAPVETSEAGEPEEADEAAATKKRRRRGGRKHRKAGDAAEPAESSEEAEATEEAVMPEPVVEPEAPAPVADEAPEAGAVPEAETVPAKRKHSRSRKAAGVSENPEPAPSEAIRETGTPEADTAEETAPEAAPAKRRRSRARKNEGQPKDETPETDTAEAAAPEMSGAAPETETPEAAPAKRRRSRPRKADAQPQDETPEAGTAPAAESPEPVKPETPEAETAPAAENRGETTPEAEAAPAKPRRKGRRHSAARQAPAPPADMTAGA